MKLTFVDSGVLIAAVRGTGEVARRALEILDDPQRSFASSEFVRLEVLPKALFHRRREEASFYEAFFGRVDQWPSAETDLTREALTLASRAGLSAIDALHAAAAVAVGAHELITTERAGKPIHRVKDVTIRTVHPGPQPSR